MEGHPTVLMVIKIEVKCFVTTVIYLLVIKYVSMEFVDAKKNMWNLNEPLYVTIEH